MTPTGKGIVLAALDILVETKTLIKLDFDEAKKIIEQIPENDHSPEESKCTAEPTSSE
jgi:hypothetical protein